ncbi:choline transporter-like 2 [Phymastichus coffea]|uniref:choline transporter-like 2 n=1 Tax=Phymastichus coffea TaxID=108790 RepID=UPI00273C86BF|nr:choline transporter-like 2 [Phymastichus coffea]
MTSADIRTTTDSGDGETKSSGGKFDEAMKSIVCQSDVNLDLTKRMDELRHFVQSGKCSRTYRKTERVEDYRCGLNATASGRQPERAGIARELYKAKYSIAGFVALSGLTALASVWLMRWHAQAYACASIFAGCALAFRCIYEKCVLDAESKTNGVLLALFLGVVALVLVVLLAIYFRTELSLACRAIEECCKAVTCVPSSLAVPLLSFAVYALAFVLGASAYRPLSSLESPVYKVDYADGEGCQCPTELGYSQNATCDPLAFDSQCQRETGTPCLLSGCYMLEKRAQSVGFLHLVNWLGLAWGFLLVTGFNDIVLASVFSTWYWTFDKKMLSYLSVIDSFWAVSTCHLGTVALGSLVIPICTTLETIVNCAKRCLRKTTRPCTAVMLLGLTSAFDQVEKFVQFIDRRAYVTCAMHGTDFFQSARTAHYLCMRNAESVVAVVTVTNWLTFMINALIACASTRIASSYYAYRADDDLSRSGAPLLLIFVGSYAICCMFTRVIEIAVDTVFVCFLEDIERNDGTSEKPYFTSERLAKLFRKK